MRAVLLVVLAGCFNPDAKPNQPCTDWCPPPETCIAGTCRVDEGARTPNYAFVTSERREMIRENVFKLDEWCQELARRGNLTGEFAAWMSTSQQSMATRLATVGARGWIRPDGKPFADTVEDIFAGRTYYPLRIADDGADVGLLDDNVATGTEANGTASAATCGDFIAPPADAAVGIGKADAGFMWWTALQSTRCSEAAHVYCFGLDRKNSVAAPSSEPKQKRVFVTKNTYTKRPPSDADLICRNEASGATTFIALVATTTQSAQERLAGATGPWARTDGVVVTKDMATFDAPLELAFDGTRIPSGEVWFGAKSLADKATVDRNCDDWGSGGSVRTGQSNRSVGAAPFDTLSGNCGGEYHYYCAER